MFVILNADSVKVEDDVVDMNIGLFGRRVGRDTLHSSTDQPWQTQSQCGLGIELGVQHDSEKGSRDGSAFGQLLSDVDRDVDRNREANPVVTA